MEGFYRLGDGWLSEWNLMVSLLSDISDILEVRSAKLMWSSHQTLGCNKLDLHLEKAYFLALESAHMPEPRSVIVYSRKGCHLCEVVKESLSKLSRHGGFTWREIDVDADADLRRQFNDEVPVVFIDGHKAFKYRMDEQQFLRKLAS
jgi:glutaredoxin